MLNKFFALIIAVYRFLFVRDDNRRTLYGKARFMTGFELGNVFPASNTGIALGNYRLNDERSFQNVCLIAPTAGGKTTKYILPNILQTDDQTSIVVTDIKGSIYKQTSGFMKERGYTIKVLRPEEPLKSFRFNPIAYCIEKKDPATTKQKLRRLAGMLVSDSTSNSDSPFWKITSQDVIFIALCALVGRDISKNTPEEKGFAHLGNVLDLINQFTTEETIKFMEMYLDDRLLLQYKGFITQRSETTDNILASAKTALTLWIDDKLVQLTHTDTIGIDDIRKNKTIIYLIVSQYFIDYYSTLLNLFYSILFEHCLLTGQDQSLSEIEKQKLLKVFFFMDEFGQLGKIQKLSNVITTIRESKCSLSLVLQNITQLENIYGKAEAETIYFGGIQTKIFLSGLSPRVCKDIENILGNKTVFDTPTGEDTPHARVLAKPLMSSDEIRMLKPEEAILIMGREKPAKIQMLPVYENTYLRNLTAKPPYKMDFDYSNEQIKALDLNKKAAN